MPKTQFSVSAPLRASFFGGGSDIPAFYRQERGRVLSTTLEQSVYVSITHSANGLYAADVPGAVPSRSIKAFPDPLIRECLSTFDAPPVTIKIASDVPFGTGLGSSAALVVALLKALSELTGHPNSPMAIAEMACRLEILNLGRPVGKQDQYASAIEGLNVFTFQPDDLVTVEPVYLTAQALDNLRSYLLFVRVPGTRDAGNVLAEVSHTLESRRGLIRELADMVDVAHDILVRSDLMSFGKLMHEGWLLKSAISPVISNESINSMYERARRCGALGGKLLGAGGSGYLLLVAPPEMHEVILRGLGTRAEALSLRTRYLFERNDAGRKALIEDHVI